MGPRLHDLELTGSSLCQIDCAARSERLQPAGFFASPTLPFGLLPNAPTAISADRRERSAALVKYVATVVARQR